MREMATEGEVACGGTCAGAESIDPWPGAGVFAALTGRGELASTWSGPSGRDCTGRDACELDGNGRGVGASVSLGALRRGVGRGVSNEARRGVL